MHASIVSLVVPYISPNMPTLCWVLAIGTPYSVYLGIGKIDRAQSGDLLPTSDVHILMVVGAAELALTLEPAQSEWAYLHCPQTRCSPWLDCPQYLTFLCLCIQVHTCPKVLKFIGGAPSFSHNWCTKRSRFFHKILPLVSNSLTHFLQQYSSRFGLIAHTEFSNNEFAIFSMFLQCSVTKCPNFLLGFCCALDRSSWYHPLQNQLLEVR